MTGFPTLSLFYETNKLLAKARIIPDLIRVFIYCFNTEIECLITRFYYRNAYPFNLRGIAFLKIFLVVSTIMNMARFRAIKYSFELLHDQT